MKFLLTQDHMGLEISKHYSSHSFHLMSAKLYEDIRGHSATMVEYRLSLFLAVSPSFKNFVAL